MKTYKKILLVIISFVFVALTFTGCGCVFHDDESTFSVLFIKDETTLTWTGEEKYSKYDVYINDHMVREFDGGKKNYSFDFSPYITSDESEYVLYLRAIEPSGEFDDSHTYAYTTVDSSRWQEISSVMFAPSANVTPVNARVIYDVLMFNNISSDDVEYYVVAIAGGGRDIRYFRSTETSFDLSDEMEKDRVYQVTVLVKYVGDDTLRYARGSEVYVNTEDDNVVDKYLSTHFIFGDKYYDLYINNQDELNQVVYYAFISRLDVIEVVIRPGFFSTLNTAAVDNYIRIAMDNIGETSYFQIEHMGFGNNILKISFNYFGVIKPTVGHKPSDQESRIENLVTPYYENYSGPKVDGVGKPTGLVYATVSSSEELYWAVSYGIEPIIINDTTGSLTRLYNKVINVLDTIIYDDMTEYEKALAVFDWIGANTSYDYATYNNLSETNLPTKYNCFYLEGVFNDGSAVCDGYSKAYAFMMNILGIPCVKISGVAGRGNPNNWGGHAWNKVALDKNGDGVREWYIVDITWSNLDVNLGSGLFSADKIDTLSHAYFLVSDADIASTHLAKSETNNGRVALNKYGYYNDYTVREDSDMKAIMTRAIETGNSYDILIRKTKRQDISNLVSTNPNFRLLIVESEIVKDYYLAFILPII